MITALTLWLGFFKMSYTCARTCIFTGCTAAAAEHIHEIHIQEEAHVYSAGILQSDYSNLFWIFEKEPGECRTLYRRPWASLWFYIPQIRET